MLPLQPAAVVLECDGLRQATLLTLALNEIAKLCWRSNNAQHVDL
ncbi:hypothetical protein U1872_20010 [Sphingomonas sp. RB3P16]